MTGETLKILCIDDDRTIVQLLVQMLTKDGFTVYSASDPRIGIAIAQKLNPDLILLDIMLPEMNGYDVCRMLQQDEQTSLIPVVFISALSQAQNKVSALAAGGVDYITKPLDQDELRAVIKQHSGKKAAWSACLRSPEPRGCAPAQAGGHRTLTDFKLSVLGRFNLEGAAAKTAAALQAGDIYKLAGLLGVSRGRVARMMADFSKRPYFAVINPDDIKLGALPLKFAVQNNIVAVNGPDNSALVAMGHPFNFELHEIIRGIMGSDFESGITEPGNISALYNLAEETGSDAQNIPGEEPMAVEESALNQLRAAAKSVKNEINDPHVKYLTGRIIQTVLAESADEMRIEPEGARYPVRFVSSGTLEEFAIFKRATANMVMARLKALAGLNMLERSKPQSGGFSVAGPSGKFRLALSTIISELGESLVIKPARGDAPPAR